MILQTCLIQTNIITISHVTIIIILIFIIYSAVERFVHKNILHTYGSEFYMYFGIVQTS